MESVNLSCPPNSLEILVALDPILPGIAEEGPGRSAETLESYLVLVDHCNMEEGLAFLISLPFVVTGPWLQYSEGKNASQKN